jgi:hypothetical protein
MDQDPSSVLNEIIDHYFDVTELKKYQPND